MILAFLTSQVSAQSKYVTNSFSLKFVFPLLQFFLNNFDGFLAIFNITVKNSSLRYASFSWNSHFPSACTVMQISEHNSMEDNLSAASGTKFAVLACYCNIDIHIFHSSFVIY